MLTIDNKLPADALRLAAAVSQLPPEHRASIQPLLEVVVDTIARRRKILVIVQDALESARLDMKYLQFDLEATARERDHYRDQIK